MSDLSDVIGIVERQISFARTPARVGPITIPKFLSRAKGFNSRSPENFAPQNPSGDDHCRLKMDVKPVIGTRPTERSGLGVAGIARSGPLPHPFALVVYGAQLSLEMVRAGSIPDQAPTYFIGVEGTQLVGKAR